ncbi:MAG: cupin domain-containing protein [Acidimicrobiales bacterium]
MRTVKLSDATPYDPDHIVAEGLLAASQSNVRMIRLSPGQALPPHTHGASDLFLYAVEGSGSLDTADGTIAFEAGTLAHYSGDEELRVTNDGADGLTLLAFLAPVFPPTQPAS